MTVRPAGGGLWRPAGSGRLGRVVGGAFQQAWPLQAARPVVSVTGPAEGAGVSRRFVLRGLFDEPAPTPPSFPTTTTIADRSDYPSGWQTWRRHYWLPPGSTYQVPSGAAVTRGRQLRLSGTVDYRIIVPESFYGLTDKLELIGGRNWVVQGLQVEFTGCNFGDYSPGRDLETVIPAEKDPGSIRNVGLYVYGRSDVAVNNDVLFRAVEGAWFKGQYFWEGFNYRANNDQGSQSTFMLQNCRVDQINWVQATNNAGNGGRDAHWGGDLFQPQSGPGRTIVRGFTGTTTYQGLFYQPLGYNFAAANVSLLELTRVQLVGSRPFGHGYLLWDNERSNPATRRVVSELYLDASPTVGLNQTSYMGGDLAALAVRGPKPGADFVPATEAGLAYPHLVPA